VIWCFHHKIHCWTFCTLVLPSESMWSGASSHNPLLNLLYTYSAFSWYVIWCFHHKIPCWTLCTLVLPSVGMWSGAFITKSPAEPCAPLFCPQLVCDLVLSSQNPLLNLCTIVLPSGCMWFGAFITKSTAEPFTPLFCPQEVCDLVLSSQDPLLSYLHACSALRKYVIWCFHHKIHCWTFYTLVLPSGSMWFGAFITRSTAEPFAPLFHPQEVCDLVLSFTKSTAESCAPLFCPQFVCHLMLLSQNPLLNLLHPCSAISEYVIRCFHYKIHCWTLCTLVLPLVCMWSGAFIIKSTAENFAPLFCPQFVCDLVLSSQDPLLNLCTIVLPSACMWSGAFITKSTAEPFGPLFCHQQVCDLVLSSQDPLLNLLHPCSALSKYVIWCFHHKIHCWNLCTPFLPSGSMWSGAFITKPTAEPFAPCSALSKYVIWCFHHKMHCWTIYTNVLPSGCMWCGAFITKSTAEACAPLFCPQAVCDPMLSSQNPLLNLFHHCSGIRMYVIWCFHHKIHCWSLCTLVLPSGSMWSDVFITKSTAEPCAPLLCPQEVCDLVLSSQNPLLNPLHLVLPSASMWSDAYITKSTAEACAPLFCP